MFVMLIMIVILRCKVKLFRTIHQAFKLKITNPVQLSTGKYVIIRENALLLHPKTSLITHKRKDRK